MTTTFKQLKEKVLPGQLDRLKKAYEPLRNVDMSKHTDAIKQATAMLNRLKDSGTLRQLAANDIPVVSDVAKNLMKRRGITENWKDELKNQGNVRVGKTDSQGNWHSVSTSDKKEIEKLKSQGYEVVKESVDIKALAKQFRKNEDENRHSENYLMLAKAFGTSREVREVEAIIRRNKIQGHTDPKDNKWMFDNIGKYFHKIRQGESVEEMFSTRSLGLKGASKRSREKARAKEKEQEKSKKKEEVEESKLYLQKEYESSEFGYEAPRDMKNVIDAAKKAGARIISQEKPSRGDPQASIEIETSNPSAVKSAINKADSEFTIDESLIVGLNKSSAEYKAGKDAAKKGIKYDANPHAPGVKRLNWSTGHNDFRADALRKAGKPNYGARGQFEEVELDEASYRGYEIKRQNNKYGHPLIVPALKLTGVNMKDIKALIDRHYLFSIEKDPTEQVDEGTWHIAKDMTKLKNAMKKPIPNGDMNWDFVAKYIGDDELWDDFQALKTGQDMVPAIKKAMKRLGIKEEVIEETSPEVANVLKKYVTAHPLRFHGGPGLQGGKNKRDFIELQKLALSDMDKFRKKYNDMKAKSGEDNYNQQAVRDALAKAGLSKHLADENKIEGEEIMSESYKDKFNAQMKKAGIDSLDDLKTDAEKKAFFKAVDKSHTADHEEEVKEENLNEKKAKFLRLNFANNQTVKKVDRWVYNNLGHANQGFTSMIPDEHGKSIEWEDIDDADALMTKLKRAGFSFTVDMREEVELTEKKWPLDMYQGDGADKLNPMVLKIRKMTDRNDHFGARVIIARMMKDKQLENFYNTLEKMHTTSQVSNAIGNDAITLRGKLEKVLISRLKSRASVLRLNAADVKTLMDAL